MNESLVHIEDQSIVVWVLVWRKERRFWFGWHLVDRAGEDAVKGN